MIDFPASPTTGQIFAGTNGVTYMWTGTIWVATGSSAGADFCAQGSGILPTTLTTTVPTTIISGNSGGWYNTGNGRFTPPAGRYQLYGTMVGTHASSTGSIQMLIRKNGAISLDNGLDTIPVINAYAQVAPSIVVDANGSDFFDWQLVGYTAATNAPLFSIGAFPISGIKGPQGDPGQLGFRLLQRTVVASAVASVQITNIASDINDLMFSFDMLPVTNAVDLYLRMYDNAGVISATGYTGASVLAQHNQTQGSAPSVNAWASIALTIGIPMNYSAAGNRVYNVHGIRGSGTIPNMRGPRSTVVNFQSAYTNDASTGYDVITGSGQRDVSPSANGITGIQLVFNGSNIATGSTFSVWGSP